MEKHEVCTVIIFVFERNDDIRDFFTVWRKLAESAFAYSTVARWHVEFTRGQSSCGDLHWCGWLATSVNEETVLKVNKIVWSDWRLSVGFITKSVGMSTGSPHSILMVNLLTKKLRTWWVPWMLSDVQKANWVKPSTSLFCLFKENPHNFVLQFSTVDKSWLHHFNTENNNNKKA